MADARGLLQKIRNGLKNEDNADDFPAGRVESVAVITRSLLIRASASVP